jgi:diadenylate cyclase
MIDFFRQLHLFGTFTVIDAAEILLVAVLIYQLFLLVRGTRAVQIAFGIFFLFLAFYLAQIFKLRTVHYMLDYLFANIVIIVVVLFQSEIRKVLANFGRNPLFRRFYTDPLEETFAEIVLAATTLSAGKTGALIVIGRETGLRDYIEKGVKLDSIFSYELLVSIFNVTSPLHDGAVVVQGRRIAAARVFLPLTQRLLSDERFGSRHRAALGITEVTDAVAVVVSEETGGVSVARDGKITEELGKEELRRLLLNLFKGITSADKRGKGGGSDRKVTPRKKEDAPAE